MKFAKGYPFYVAEADGEVVGYGLLRPHMPFGTFRRTAELTCFRNAGKKSGKDFDEVWLQLFVRP